MNSIVILGCFRGPDIEPGTFHACNVQNSNLSRIKNDSEGNEVMPDQEEQEEASGTSRYPEDNVY